MNVLLACMYVQYSVGFPGTIVIDGYETPRGYWKPNLGPLQDRQTLLITEPSF